MTINRLGLHVERITARVYDIARATAWYRDVLGMTVGHCGEQLEGRMKYAHLHWSGFGISLVQLDLPSLEPAVGQLVLPCWVHPVFAVNDPDRLYHQLQQEGARVVVRGHAGTGPINSFLLYDSEGNELEIVTRT
jgi:catechol 2,3-dioxygenase-like lactoylglutathione lyase family enzyme